MDLKTPSGRVIDSNSIDYILYGKQVTGIPGTLVRLKTDEEVFLENSEEEVSVEMSKAADESGIDRVTGESIHVGILGL
jgi:hypothetical protein